MNRVLNVAIGIVLLTSVLIVFIAPAVDLEPIALRAMQAATLFYAVLAVAGTTIASMVKVSNPRFTEVFGFHPIETSTVSLFELNCSRLC